LPGRSVRSSVDLLGERLALAESKDLSGAIASYRRAIAIDRNDAHAHFNLGDALRDSNDLPGAIACFRRAVDLDPKYAVAHTHLGNALALSQDPAGATASFRRALAIDPRLALAHVGLGVALADAAGRGAGCWCAAARRTTASSGRCWSTAGRPAPWRRTSPGGRWSWRG
jgi:tetratricopeptide (TPR) repeat protein